MLGFNETIAFMAGRDMTGVTCTPKTGFENRLNIDDIISDADNFLASYTIGSIPKAKKEKQHCT